MRRKSVALLLGLGISIAACGWDPRRPFERFSPDVDKAIVELDASQREAATGRLENYLSSTRCDGGQLVVPGAADASNATFDLGLALFGLAETYGRPFGDHEMQRDGGPTQEEKQLALLRGDQIDCAKAALDAILGHDLPPDLEARARYLRGNLAFLERRWKDAVEDYDKALRIIPGLPADAGVDGIGRDAAWNRALALRNDEEDQKKDAGPDADADADGGPDADADAADAPEDRDGDAPDAPGDAPNEAGPDGGDGGDGGGQDGGQDGGNDGGKDGGNDQRPDAGGEDAATPPPTTNQDERMLDQFEQAPTWQREEAKSRAGGRRVRGMADK